LKICTTVSQRQIAAILLVAGALLFVSSYNSYGQQQGSDWQRHVRELAKDRQWEAALKTVERRLAEFRTTSKPEDGARACSPGWTGCRKQSPNIALALTSAPTTAICRKVWQGCSRGSSASGKRCRCSIVPSNSDPRRSDLLLARGRILRALDRPRGSARRFAAAMYLDPSNREARDGLASLRPEAHHELRIGSDTDWFNFADANHAQSASLASRWSSRWSTNFAAAFYQRAGFLADKSTASVTGRSANWARSPSEAPWLATRESFRAAKHFSSTVAVAALGNAPFSGDWKPAAARTGSGIRPRAFWRCPARPRLSAA